MNVYQTPSREYTEAETLIAKHLSHVKLVVLTERLYSTNYQNPPPEPKKINNTLLICQKSFALNPSCLSQYFSLISPHLDPNEDGSILNNPALLDSQLTYLVKERGFDVNHV